MESFLAVTVKKINNMSRASEHQLYAFITEPLETYYY